MVQLRTAAQSEMVAYLDEDVGKTLSDINDLKAKVDERLKLNNEVSLHTMT